MLDQLTAFWNRWRKVGGHWQNLKPFFGLTGIRFFVTWFALTPVVVHLFQRVPPVVHLPLADRNIELNFELPFSWWILWFASLAYTIALVVYRLWAPTFVNDYPNFGTYSEARHSPRWLVWELYYCWKGITNRQKLIDRLLEKKLVRKVVQLPTPEPIVEERGTVLRLDANGSTYEVCIPETLGEIEQREYYWEIFGRWAESRSLARWIAWTLLFFAILLFLGVVVENIGFVLGYLFTRDAA